MMKQLLVYLAILSLILGLLDQAYAQNELQGELVSSDVDEETLAHLDMQRDIVEIIESRGFGVEEHRVHTKDGYILTVHRVLNPLMDEEQRKQMKPVLIMHGIFTSSINWIINTGNVRPELTGSNSSNPSHPTTTNQNDYNEQAHPNSLAFYLVNRGYDVWLGNMRGNSYANRHEQYNDWNPNFWNFTLDEIIQFDLPGTIELVQKETGHKKIAYIGYSQGTTIAFGLLSKQPKYSDIMDPVVALAPVAYIDMRSPIAKLIRVIDSPENVNWWYKLDSEPTGKLAARVCNLRVVKKLLCRNAFFLLVGFNEDELKQSRLDAMLSRGPEPTSVKVVAHWSQIARSGKFQQFDRGSRINKELYGSSRPARYPLGAIRSKMYLFVSDNDNIATQNSVQELIESLNVEPEVFNLSQVVPKWNHIDYQFSWMAGLVVNARIEQVLREAEDA